MTDSLSQADINALASDIERLCRMMESLSETISNQETTLKSVGAAVSDKLTPFVEKLNGAFVDAQSFEAPLAETLAAIDSEIGEKATEVGGLLTEILNQPPADEVLERFDQAIETAEAVNSELTGRLAELEALVDDAEQQVLDAVDALKDQSTDLTEELLETLSSGATEFSETLAEEVFAPVRAALETLRERLTEVVTEEVEEILDGQIARVAGEVSEALDAVLDLLRRSAEQLMDEIAAQLSADTAAERDGRQTLEEALVPLESALDLLRSAYGAFKGIAGSVGVSLPDLG